MTDERPSIAELQRAATHHGDPKQQSILLRADIANILLEIAAAALVANSTRCDCHGESSCSETCSAWQACHAFDIALTKVRQ